MPLQLLLGGARSGKSALAVRRAQAAGTPVAGTPVAAPVVFVATGQARDAEMAVRIARHRAQRPTTWATVEAPLDLAAAVGDAPATATLLIDCLSMWVANVMAAGPGQDDADAVDHGSDAEAAITARAAAAADLAAGRPGLTIAVSNEVGLGVVPAYVSGRRYRDLLGRTNAAWAARADRAELVVAGRVLALERADG